MIQAENGVLNLKKFMFQSNRNVSIERTTQIQVHSHKESTDTFAKALEQKVEQRIAKKHEQPQAKKTEHAMVQKESPEKRDNIERMPDEKLNKKHEVQETKADPIDEKLKELKDELKKEGKEITSEMEAVLAELLAIENIPMEQLEELATTMHAFAEMEALTQQPLMEVMDALPDALVDQITTLSEMIQASVETFQEGGEVMLPNSLEESEFAEQLQSIMATIEETLGEMEKNNGQMTDLAGVLEKDVVQVLKQLDQVFGEALKEDSGDKAIVFEEIKDFAKVFEMIESAEKKENTTPLVRLQEIMNQESSNAAVKFQASPSQSEGEQTFGKGQEHQAHPKEVGTSMQDADQESKQTQESEGKSQGVEKATTMVTKTSPQMVQTEMAKTPEQAMNQTFDVNQVVQTSKVESVQMGRVHQNILNQVVNAANMSFNLEDETSEMLIKLKPNSLGNVELKVSIEKGVLLAEFNVESQIVKEALESNLADLRNALSDKGFNVHDLNVSVGQDQQKQGQSSQHRTFAKRQKHIELNAVESVFEKASLESISNRSTIDYLG